MYIPYFFSDDDNQTTIHCRNIKTGEYKFFISEYRNWIIIKPFRYSYENEEDIIESLKRVFKTNQVKKYEEYYILSDYDNHNYIENDYKEVIKLPSNYTTKILLNNRRYFNLFSENDEWTSEKGTSYPDIESHHFFLTEDLNGNFIFKFANDSKFQILTPSIWENIYDRVDVIFTTIRRSKFTLVLPEKIDYAWISPYWRENIENMDEWYQKNIKDIFLLMYMSSRNVSDILWLNSREDWNILTDDIFISKDLGMYGKARLTKYNKNYAIPGKYRNIYVYNLGEILKNHMKNCTDHNTEIAYRICNSLSKFPYIVSSIYNNESVSPAVFSIPENSIYLNERYLFTISPLEGYKEFNKIEYVIVLGEGSYMTFDQKNQDFKVYGQHPLCRPLFAAAKKSIRNYMMWDSQGGDANIRIISDMIDKNEETLCIPTVVNQFNYKRYMDVLPEDIKTRFGNGTITEYVLNLWLTNKGLVGIYDPNIVDVPSNNYIYGLLKQIDKIKKVLNG